ncbi:MAG: alpha/beta fold hydrolase [Nocardioidaceae bacterium]
MFAALSPARRRFMLILVGLMAAGTLAVTVLVVRATRVNDVQPVAQDLPGPVLLVPGYGGSTESLLALAGALREEGRDVTVVATPGSGTGDLVEQAETLSGAVDAALERTGDNSVDVIGYSAGGVVARLWVRDFEGGSRARRVVTLGSPHHGANLAGLARDITPSQCPMACQQLAPQSDLLRTLNAGDETPPGPVYVTIWTATDEVVEPPDSAALEGGLNIIVQSLCPGADVSHGDLPREPALIALVLRQVEESAPSVPEDADCQSLSS